MIGIFAFAGGIIALIFSRYTKKVAPTIIYMLAVIYCYEWWQLAGLTLILFATELLDLGQ
jgi:hypothetical protein